MDPRFEIIRDFLVVLSSCYCVNSSQPVYSSKMFNQRVKKTHRTSWTIYYNAIQVSWIYVLGKSTKSGTQIIKLSYAGLMFREVRFQEAVPFNIFRFSVWIRDYMNQNVKWDIKIKRSPPPPRKKTKQ